MEDKYVMIAIKEEMRYLRSVTSLTNRYRSINIFMNVSLLGEPKLIRW